MPFQYRNTQQVETAESITASLDFLQIAPGDIPFETAGALQGHMAPSGASNLITVVHP